jgi:hypothetical protein
LTRNPAGSLSDFPGGGRWLRPRSHHQEGVHHDKNHTRSCLFCFCPDLPCRTTALAVNQSREGHFVPPKIHLLRRTRVPLRDTSQTTSLLLGSAPAWLFFRLKCPALRIMPIWSLHDQETTPSRIVCASLHRPADRRRQARSCSNSSMRLPEGSCSRICFAPIPTTISLRNRAPAFLSRATVPGKSSTAI